MGANCLRVARHGDATTNGLWPSRHVFSLAMPDHSGSPIQHRLELGLTGSSRGHEESLNRGEYQPGLSGVMNDLTPRSFLIRGGASLAAGVAPE